MVITYIHLNKESPENDCTLEGNFRRQVLFNFSRTMENILSGNITDWHGLFMEQNRKALKQVLKLVPKRLLKDTQEQPQH